MSRFHSYINTAKNLIETFNGEKPLAIFLRQFFAANKKYGGKDRRYIASLCYNYFRIGFAGTEIPSEQKMLLATYLCETEQSRLLENLKPEWNKNIGLPLEEKLATLDFEFHLNDIFPFCDQMSDEIEAVEFCKSFLVQPDLFIRIRPRSSGSVLRKLEQSNLNYQLIGKDCVELAVSNKIEEFFIPDKEVVVQDYNSQKVLDYLKRDDLEINSKEGRSNMELNVWDCCAASGGKSILLTDVINKKFHLTVSDIRPGIILNLHQRFKKAGLKEYKYFIADIGSADFKRTEPGFDLVICDAPCSGSGTWSRTPEQLCFFKLDSINKYSILQKKIIANVLPYLQPGGLFIYITCSVFKNENEIIAAFISENFNCTLLDQRLLKGYGKKADNMFVAVFRKL